MGITYNKKTKTITLKPGKKEGDKGTKSNPFTGNDVDNFIMYLSKNGKL